MKRFVYADNAATTPVSQTVLNAMLPYYTEKYGNPSSLYAVGREAKKALEEARENVANHLGALPNEIFFTSGGSEADNWAIKGVAHELAKQGKKHIITSKFEHHAVLHTTEALEKEGFEVTYLEVYENGIVKPEDVEKGLPFDRMLYIARREFEQSNDNTYVVSMSSRTIVYKGMFLVGQLRTFFEDLQSPDYESAIAMVHSRFSTNTNPSWERAHPNRFMVHNGEINTIRGNADKMLAREETMASGKLRGEFQKVLPVINTEGSDSAMLDNTLEFLVMSGMELPLAVMIMIPEPWANNAIMSQKKKDFYQYYLYQQWGLQH